MKYTEANGTKVVNGTWTPITEESVELETELETSGKMDGEEAYYLVISNEIYRDEMHHEILSIWDNLEDALKEAEKKIKEEVQDNYKRTDMMFYGACDDTIYATYVCPKGIKREKSVKQVL